MIDRRTADRERSKRKMRVRKKDNGKGNHDQRILDDNEAKK